jgi:hypothetical protein
MDMCCSSKTHKTFETQRKGVTGGNSKFESSVFSVPPC